MPSAKKMNNNYLEFFNRKSRLEEIKKMPVEKRIENLYEALSYINNAKGKLLLLSITERDAEKVVTKDKKNNVTEEEQRVPPALYKLLKAHILTTISEVGTKNRELIEFLMLYTPTEGKAEKISGLEF